MQHTVEGGVLGRVQGSGVGAQPEPSTSHDEPSRLAFSGLQFPFSLPLQMSLCAIGAVSCVWRDRSRGRYVAEVGLLQNRVTGPWLFSAVRGQALVRHELQHIGLQSVQSRRKHGVGK